MPRSGINALSRQQRRCLQLAARGLTSPEIAHELSISAKTVDGYFAEAIARLGVPNRKRAVALLVDHEQRGTPPDKTPGEIVRVETWPVPASHLEPSSVCDVNIGTPFKVEPVVDRLPPQATGEGSAGDIYRVVRLVGWILGIAAAIVVLLLAIPPLADGASHFANAIQPRHKR